MKSLYAGVFGLMVWLCPWLVYAACTGSNPTWTSTPDSASVTSCISQATAGATINVSAGTATWSSPINVNKPITLAGAGIGNTVITGIAQIVDPSTPYTGVIRITGFTFQQGSGSYAQIWSTPSFRIDHCRWTRTNHDWLIFVGGSESFDSQGLFDHNEFLNGSIVVFGNNGSDNGGLQWSEPLDLGTARAVYIEDNSFTFDFQSGSYPGSLDANHGSMVVFRYNTNIGGRLEQHSLQGDNQRAVRKWEFYNNSFTNPSFQNFRPMFIRGGTGMVFHNTHDDGYISNDIDIDNARSSEDSISGQVASFGMCTGTSRADGNTSGQEGYPCRDQIGRSTDAAMWSNYAATGPAQAFQPAYFWRNTAPSGEIAVARACETSGNASCTRQNTYHILQNRDYYAYNASFTGAAGVGEGVLASRPSTCTVGTAYWVTDQGEWNSTNGATADGRLDVCTSTNTWTAGYYMPYTYPHPLIAGASAAPTATITAPNGGANVTVGSATLTTLAGTASDDVAVTSVTWVCDVCGSGTATGTTSWTVGSITLQPGANVITVSAHDGDGQLGTDTITVTYTNAAPTVTITTNGGAGVGAPFATTATPLSPILQGTASDDVSVSSVTVACIPSCGSPTVTGTTTWSVTTLSLQPGANVITVTATDGGSQTGTDILFVTYTPAGLAVATGLPRITTTLTATTSVTTDAFAVDTGTTLLVTVSGNQSSAGTAATWTITDNQGTHLTYTEVARRSSPEGATRTAVIAWTAPVTTFAYPFTITVTLTGGTNGGPSIKVYPLTGVGTPVIGAQTEGDSTSNVLTTASVTPQTSGLGFIVASEWTAVGTPTSADLTLDGFVNSSTIAGGSGFKSLTSGVGATGTLDGAGTGAAEWQYLWFEVRAGSITLSAPANLRIIR